MTGNGEDPPDRNDAFSFRRAERDRTLEAVHRLEGALAMASGGTRWIETVASDLEVLEAAVLDEQREARRPDALLSMIAAENPRRFGSRVENLREQHDDIAHQVAALRREVQDPDPAAIDASDLRHRVGWVVRAVHHHLARQTDLVYEALELDLGER